MSAASPTFHGFLHPSDASASSATPSSGSSTPEVFFDAGNQMPVTHLRVTPIHVTKSEQFLDAPMTPATSVSVYSENNRPTQGLHGHGNTEIEPGPPHQGHGITSDVWNKEGAGKGHDFFNNRDGYENGVDEALPQKATKRERSSDTNDRTLNTVPATSLHEPQEDQKPKARRFLIDFLPQKQTGSNLREETRKIVQMLSNDKTYKIDRPSLGLQDRLQSLVQRSAGKRTSYIKGPRVCSTLVKLIVKRTQDSLCLRRGSFQGYSNEQEDKSPLLAFNKPIQSYIKPPKHSKAFGGNNAPPVRGNQVNNANGFEMIKRRMKDNNNVPNEVTDSRTSLAVSTSPSPPADDPHVTSNITPHLTTITTTTAIPHITQHASQNHLDPHIEEQTTGSTHKQGENTHVSTTVNLTQDTHDEPKQNLINVEFKISVPYRSQDQDTPDCTDHRPSFPDTLANNDDDDDDEDNYDYENDHADYEGPPDDIEFTSVKHDDTVSCNSEHDEINRPKMKEATVISQYLQDEQDATFVNLRNGHTEQTNLSPPDNGSKMPLLHPNNIAPLSQQQGDAVTNGTTDLRKHIASLNKVSLKFSMKNKEHKSDLKNDAVPDDPPTSPKQHLTPLTTRPMDTDTNYQVARVTGRGNRECTTFSSLSEPRFCLATAIENVSLPFFKGGEAMLRRLSYTDTSQAQQQCLSTRDLLYTDVETQQTSASPQSALHINTLMRLKTNNLVARYGGKNTHLQSNLLSHQTSPTPASATPDHTAVQEDTPESISVLESLPPIPPNVQKAKPTSVSRQASREDAGAASPPASQIDRRHSKAGGHWTRSRNASLEHPCLGSRRSSKRPSFSQDALRKCLMAAVDQCYNTEWEETCNSDGVKDHDLSQEELNKSLVKAVSRHDAEKVRVLLKLGADPNVKCGNTPALLRAAREGALYVMQALLSAGADVDVRTDLGNSPLHLAARGGYGEGVVQLVHSGAFVDAINRSGVTPLQMALAHGHLEVAHSLLRLNADIFLQNKVGETAYDVANELGYIGLCGPPLEVRRDSGVGTRVELPSTDIPVAVRMIQGIEEGCAGTVDDCLREGASPNTLLPLALHWPARASVLHRAAHHGHDLIVQLLLAAGADINIRDVVGNTSLHVAAQAGHNRVVKILLECGAPREAVSQSGMTPLHRAASKGKELTCNLLIRRGSNRRAEDSSGRTPADWARKRGFKHLSQKLMYRRKSSNTLLAEEDEKQRLEHLHRLHEAALKAPHQSPEPMNYQE